MGVVKTVGYDFFPRQSDQIHKRVKVVFRYDTSKQIEGTIVRDDREEPWLTIIRLDDGRYVEASECMYQIIGSLMVHER